MKRILLFVFMLSLTAFATDYTESFEDDSDISNWSHFDEGNVYTTETWNSTGGVGGSGALELGDGGYDLLDKHEITATVGTNYKLTLDIKTENWDDQANYPIYVTVQNIDSNPDTVYVNGSTAFTTITLTGTASSGSGYIRIKGSNTALANKVWIDNVNFDDDTQNNDYVEAFETDADISNWSHFDEGNVYTSETWNSTGGVGGSGALELGDGGYDLLDKHEITATVGTNYKLTLDIKTENWDDQTNYPIYVTVQNIDSNPDTVYVNGSTSFTTITLSGTASAGSGYIRIKGSNTALANKVWIDNVNFDDNYAPSSINDTKSGIVRQFNLLQNYPNPFNPTTTIPFEISKASNVRIRVFDMAGKKVADLCDEFFQTGKHEISFNASNLSSGIYFYSIQADNFTTTRKMTILK